MQDKDFSEIKWRVKKQAIVFRHLAALEFLRHGSLLDIGCGDGLFLEMSGKEKSIIGQGVDFSSNAVLRTRERGFNAQEIDFTKDRLPFQDNTFDNVVILDVLEHLFQPDKILREAKRVSRKYIIIGVPNFSSLPARLQVLFGKIPENNLHQKGHVFWFNWSILNKMVAEVGLKIVDIKYNVPKKLSFTRLFGNVFLNLLPLSYVVLLSHDKND